MIEKLFNEQTVAVDVQVKDWVEAIKFGGNLLVNLTLLKLNISMR